MIDKKINETMSLLASSPILGIGSCSTYDECYTEGDLRDEVWDFFESEPTASPEDAMDWFLKLEGMRYERENEYSEPDSDFDAEWRAEMERE